MFEAPKLAVLDKESDDDPVRLTIDFDHLRIETTISVDNIPPPVKWQSRKEDRAAAMASMEKWMSLTESERTEVVYLVRSAIGSLYDNVENWIPSSLAIDEIGDHIGVEFHMLATELRKRIDIRDEINTFEMNELSRLARELADHAPLPED